MKPLETSQGREEKAKKSHRTIRTISIILAIIMVSSTIGYAILETSQKENKTTYGDYKFIQTDSSWQTQVAVSNQIIVLNSDYLPQDVENISFDGSISTDDFLGKGIFIVASSGLERQKAEKFNVLSPIALRMQLACPYNSSAGFCIDYNMPEKDCSDADSSTSIIIISEDNETSANYGSYCLTIKGNGDELAKAVENAIFRIFGILN